MINPHLSWHKPQALKAYPYQPDLSSIPKEAGVYVFYRTYGPKKFQVFYVGKAKNLRNRIKGQLNNLKLMTGIQMAANGARYLAYAEVALKPGQKPEPTIHAAEKLLIRHYVEEGHELLNIQGIKIRIQTLTNERPSSLNKLVPLRTQVDA
jgi:hypothetical protein